ncbi:MAG: nucleotidyl transferase AbiEii/AbiGii toxin family protein [Patescibacteria group bacterium]|jgi:predicted nucleotidyltransferase component of viral defense system
MEQTLLTDRQRAVLLAVSHEPGLAEYYLSGGTALSAYHFQHRISDDLDFFTVNPPDKQFLLSFVQKLRGELNAQDVRFEHLYDRNLYFLTFADGYELKLEFTRYPFPRLDPSAPQNGMVIDSLRDIAANKLMAMLDRFDPKDFVDMYFLLQERKLDDVRADAQKKFAVKISEVFLGGELAKVSRVEALPKMLKPLTVPELKRFFSERARELAPSVLL